MKVAFFLEGTFLPARDGASFFAQNITNDLVNHGVEVCVLHCYRKWSNVGILKKQPFSTYLLPPDKYYHDIGSIIKILKKERVNILQMRDAELLILQGRRIKNILSLPLCFEVHSVLSYSSYALSSLDKDYLEFLDYIAGFYSDHLICFTPGDKRKLIDIGVLGKKITVLPIYVNTNEIKFHGPNLNARKILFIGNFYFEPNKKAVAKIADMIYPQTKKLKKDIKFIFVGTCPRNLRIRYQREDFQFLGYIEDLNKVFSMTSIAIAPVEYTTGISVKLLNYAAAGLPIIATSSAANGINLIDGIFIEDSITNYPNIIQKFFANSGLAFRIGLNARKQVEKFYSCKRIIPQIVNIYTNCYTLYLKKKCNQQNNDIRNQKFSGNHKNQEYVKRYEITTPMWLEETVKKGRFKHKTIKTHIYGVVGKGVCDVAKVTIPKR